MNQEQAAVFATRQIRAYMNSAGVGFNGNTDFVGLLGPEPFFVTAQEWRSIIETGAATWQWIEAAQALYCRALQGDSELNFLVALIEGESTEEIIALNRRVALSGRIRPPCFLRLDEPFPGQAVEAQIPGSGWGYRTALTHAFDKWSHPDCIQEFIRAAQDITGKANPRIVHVRRKPEFKNDDEYFAKAVRAEGVDFRVCVRAVPPPGDVDLIIRHYLSDFMDYPGAREAIGAYLEGAVEIDPPPSLLTDQKVGMILPFDSRSAEFFSHAVRGLFPETKIVERGMISQIMSQTSSKRAYVLKYAGLHRDMRAQGKAVFNLGQCSVKKAQELEQQIEQSGQPWIIQQLLSAKFAVCAETTANGPLAEQLLYARFNPVFALTIGNPRIMACTVNLRNFWKVSSHHDSVSLPVVVS